MRLTHDQSDYQKNLLAHGILLTLADHIQWDALVVLDDTRQPYDETRKIGYAPVDQRLYCVVFVDREESRHIISLRRANSREVARYEQSQTD